MSFFNTIVVATDFSETAEEALSVALEIGRETRGRLELVNVVPDPLQQPWMVEAAGVDLGALQHAWLHAAAKELQALVKRRRLDPPTVGTHVVIGRPDFEIVRFAQEHSADLIVMGTHGYGGVKRLLLGSVADHVVRQATCPVLVVPSRTARGESRQISPGEARSRSQRHDDVRMTSRR